MGLVAVTVGGAFFISAAQSGFNNQVIKYIAIHLPEIDPAVVLGTGATQIRVAFTATQVPIVLSAYVVGLRAVFAIAVGAFAISAIVGIFGSWKKLHAAELEKVAGGAA